MALQRISRFDNLWCNHQDPRLHGSYVDPFENIELLTNVYLVQHDFLYCTADRPG